MDNDRYQGEIFVKAHQEHLAFVRVCSDAERGKELAGLVLRIFPSSITPAMLASRGMAPTTWVTFTILTLGGEDLARDLAQVEPPAGERAEEIARRATKNSPE